MRSSGPPNLQVADPDLLLFFLCQTVTRTSEHIHLRGIIIIPQGFLDYHGCKGEPYITDTATREMSMKSSSRQSRRLQRTEKDTFGDIEVASDRYWGAQTQRYILCMQK